MTSKEQSRDDELDLDDLDDIVDQFDNKPETKPPAAPLKSSTSPTTVPAAPPASAPENETLLPEDQALSDELAKQLASDMEELVRQFAAAQGTENAELSEEEKERREAFERMLVEGMNGMDLGALEKELGGETSLKGPGPKVANEQEDPFQKSIRQAMEKLRDTSDSLGTSSADEPPDDALKELLAQLGGDGGADNEEALQGLLENMMKQLMTKEVLYEPLKELHDKFPKYLAENAATLPKEDKERYEGQLDRVTKIVAIFENPTYKDDDAEKSAQVVTLMNEMQAFGSPPSEIMGPLPPGLDFGAGGDPTVPDGCVIS